MGGASRRHLRTLFKVGVTAGLTDRELLQRFVTATGETAELAFAALVERHGPMVYRTCRAVLRDDHEAHDAFQATFLVLVKKSRALWVRGSLGPWLHKVARRAAGRARATAARRQALERRAAGGRDETGHDTGLAELLAILHEEVDRLPARYRVPIVLCDLEGRSHEDAARHLACPEGTIKSRLARGRERLRGQLIRRGLAPVAALSVVGSGEATEAALVPETLVEATLQNATQLTSAAATGTIPPSVAALTEGVLQMMFQGKLKLIAASVFAMAGLVLAMGSLAQQATNEPAPKAPPKQVSRPVERSRWIGTFTNGTTVEVVGISTYPTGPNTWWGPDGKPLAEAPCDPLEKHMTAQDAVYRVIVVRWTGQPPDSAAGWWIGGTLGSDHRTARRAGNEIAGLSLGIMAFPRELPSCTVECDLAAGAWKTFRTTGAVPGSSGSGGANGRAYMFSEPMETRTGVALVVTHNIEDEDVRFIAVDREGKLRLPVRDTGSGAGGFYQMVHEFELRLEQVGEFRLQTRPFERLTIKDVALNPAE
jgi:RNA polymerase sigma factor (sigma-70 family)